jgi:hypothetical protein
MAKKEKAYRVTRAFSHAHQDGTRTWFTRRNQDGLAKLPEGERAALIKSGAVEEYERDASSEATAVAVSGEAPAGSQAAAVEGAAQDAANAEPAPIATVAMKTAAKTTSRER